MKRGNGKDENTLSKESLKLKSGGERDKKRGVGGGNKERKTVFSKNDRENESTKENFKTQKKFRENEEQRGAM